MSDFSNNLKQLGQELRQMREQRGLRQEDVAARAGVSRSMMIRVEAGVTTVSSSSYARVAAAIGAQLSLEVAQRPTLDEIGAILGDTDG